MASNYVPFVVIAGGFDDFSTSERALRGRDSAAFLADRVFGDAPSAVRASGFKLL